MQAVNCSTKVVNDESVNASVLRECLYMMCCPATRRHGIVTDFASSASHKPELVSQRYYCHKLLLEFYSNMTMRVAELRSSGSQGRARTQTRPGRGVISLATEALAAVARCRWRCPVAGCGLM
jgi:hypothetical protein